MIIGIIIRIIRIINCTLDAVLAECVTAWQGLWLVVDEIAYRTLHRVLDTLQKITRRACHHVQISLSEQYINLYTAHHIETVRINRSSFAST